MSRNALIRIAVISSAFVLLAAFVPPGEAANEAGATAIRGKVAVGATESAVGEYSFLNDSPTASKIFSVCKADDVCELSAKVLRGVIVQVESVNKVNEGPPPADAVWDTRAACLYGSMEGDKVSTKDRLAACDDLGELESKALDAGYCWNQSHGEYMPCG